MMIEMFMKSQSKFAIIFIIRYHIPRSFIKPSENLIVVLEEEIGNPNEMDIVLVNRDTICSFITEYHPPNVRSWQRKDSKIRPVLDVVKPAAHLKCPNHKEIIAVEFASFGDPYGVCGSFLLGNCTAPVAKDVVEQVKHIVYDMQLITLIQANYFVVFGFEQQCLGKTSCSVPMERELFLKNNDACPDIKKTLAIQVKCGRKKH